MQRDKKSRRALTWGKNWVISYVHVTTAFMCCLTTVVEVESSKTQERILGPSLQLWRHTTQGCVLGPRAKQGDIIVQKSSALQK